MASLEAVAEPLKKQPKVIIYFMDKSLEKQAEDLKKFLEYEHSPKICLHDYKNSGENIGMARQHYATCSMKYKEKMKHGSNAIIDIRSFKEDFIDFMPATVATDVHPKSKHTSDSDSNSDCDSAHDVTRASGKASNPRRTKLLVNILQGGLFVEVKDAVVILGHSSMLGSGSAVEYLLAAVTKLQPTIVAFLCCNEGNSRYNPILKFAQLLYPKCIVGFYQRRVYVEELLETNLVVGLRNFLCIIPYYKGKFPFETDPRFMTGKATNVYGLESTETNYKQLAIKAFACAKLNEHDPTTFVNDSENLNLVEILHQAGFYPTIDNYVIPVSYFQLAMFHPMMLNSAVCPINISMNSIINTLPVKTFCELDIHCMKESRKYLLNKIIPLILEIGLIKLCSRSLDLIKKGTTKSWMSVDHLQFLLAMLRGYWGRNSLPVIREWSTFHLMEMMDVCNKDKKDLDDPYYLHQYKLCCICYALLCEHHFVRFAEYGEDYYKFGILAFSTLGDTQKYYYQVTFDGYIRTTDHEIVHRPNTFDLPHPSAPFKGTELPWDQLFSHCQSIEDCVNLHKNNTAWEISDLVPDGAGAGGAAAGNGSYTYESLDFKLAMIALADQFLRKRTLRTRSYNVKDFRNEDNRCQGIMKIFDEAHMSYFTVQGEYTFVEMRVIIDKSKFKAKKYMGGEDDSKFQSILECYTEHKEEAVRQFTIDNVHQKLIQYKNLNFGLDACRFVFARFNESQLIDQSTPIQGILFYTDNHYGQNLIDFANIHALQHQECKDSLQAVPNKSFMNKLHKLCAVCLYRMQQIIIDNIINRRITYKFPFVKAGRLTLHHQDQTLVRIELEPAVSYPE